MRLVSGSPLTISSGVDNALSATADQRANQVLASAYHPDKSVDRYLNPAAFAQPATGSYGTSGVNSIRGPGRMTIDMGLTRKFQVRENHSIEFRAEAFNVPNHLNPGNPTVTLNNSNFGRIQSAGDPRIMQVALKYVF